MVLWESEQNGRKSKIITNNTNFKFQQNNFRNIYCMI